ncbi:MAG TPA: trigger factor [Gemmatimonadota bacterium]|nr:trigger factor [Gemmatimonadota bacterium]
MAVDKNDKATTPAPGVEVTLTEGEGWERILTVTVPEERVAKTRAAETGRFSRSVKLKGFRKGKVPAAVVEQRFGEQIDERVQQRLLDEAYRQALEEAELSPAGPGRITDIRYEPGQPFVFKAELEVMPTVRLQRTGGFQVDRTVAAVTDDEVTEILERIRDENADWVAVDRRPEIGERVTVRIAPLRAGEDTPSGEGTPYQLVLGEGKALEDVETAIRTLGPGESGIFEIEFPAEDGDGEGGDVEETPAEPITRRLHITLGEVEEKDLPELTDEFASEVGSFETVAELEAAVRDDLSRHHEKEAEDELRGRLMNALREANPFVVPQALVDRYIENMIQAPDDTDADELRRMREAIGPHAERQIRDQLLLEAIIDQEDLAPTPDELEGRIAELAESRGVAPAKLRRDLVREGQLEALGQNLAVEKAFAYLKQQSGVA